MGSRITDPSILKPGKKYKFWYIHSDLITTCRQETAKLISNGCHKGKPVPGGCMGWQLDGMSSHMNDLMRFSAELFIFAEPLEPELF